MTKIRLNEFPMIFLCFSYDFLMKIPTKCQQQRLIQLGCGLPPFERVRMLETCWNFGTRRWNVGSNGGVPTFQHSNGLQEGVSTFQWVSKTAMGSTRKLLESNTNQLNIILLVNNFETFEFQKCWIFVCRTFFL